MSALIIQKCSASAPYPRTQQAPVRNAEFTAIRGPHGNIPIGVFYPKSREAKRKFGGVATLIYFHGGGYTVRTVNEVGNGLRIVVGFDVALNMRLREMRKSLAAQLLLYSEARLPFGTLAAARKIIGHYLDWKVASLCKRCVANRCISNGISHSQIIGFPAPPRKCISRGMLYLSDLGNVPPAPSSGADSILCVM